MADIELLSELCNDQEGSMTTWTRQDEAAAMREGWYISHSPEGCDEILRHDDAEIFPSDVEAIAHVYWKAGTGSDLHRRAIAYTLREGNNWTYERPLRKYKADAEAGQAKDRLGDIMHQASNTSNGVRIVLRQHTKGFSRTILRNIRTKENPMWRTLEHQEYRLEIDSGM